MCDADDDVGKHNNRNADNSYKILQCLNAAALRALRAWNSTARYININKMILHVTHDTISIYMFRRFQIIVSHGIYTARTGVLPGDVYFN